MSQKVSREVKLLMKELRNTAEEEWREALDSVVEYQKRGTVPKIPEGRACRVLVAGFHSLLTSLSRRRGKQLQAATTQLTETGLDKKVLDAVLGVLSESEDDITRFSEVDWRLDVILSNQSLGKVLQPEVLMKMSLTDGSSLDLQLSQQEFHALRQATARTLFELCQLRERKFISSS